MSGEPSRVMFYEARRLNSYAKLSQKEKSVVAKAAEVDETGDTFLCSFKTIDTHKKK